jgi:hypothetical protein
VPVHLVTRGDPALFEALAKRGQEAFRRGDWEQARMHFGLAHQRLEEWLAKPENAARLQSALTQAVARAKDLASELDSARIRAREAHKELERMRTELEGERQRRDAAEARAESQAKVAEQCARARERARVLQSELVATRLELAKLAKVINSGGVPSPSQRGPMGSWPGGPGRGRPLRRNPLPRLNRQGAAQQQRDTTTSAWKRETAVQQAPPERRGDGIVATTAHDQQVLQRQAATKTQPLDNVGDDGAGTTTDHDTSPRTEMPASQATPPIRTSKGEKYDLVGTWVVSSNESAPCEVRLDRDGGVILTSSPGHANTPNYYELNHGLLEFYHSVNGNHQLLERGRVEWTGDDEFSYGRLGDPHHGKVIYVREFR